MGTATSDNNYATTGGSGVRRLQLTDIIFSILILIIPCYFLIHVHNSNEEQRYTKERASNVLRVMRADHSPHASGSYQP